MLAGVSRLGRLGQPLRSTVSGPVYTPLPSARTNLASWWLKTSNGGQLSSLADGRSSTTIFVLERESSGANEVLFQDPTQNLSGMRFNTGNNYRMRLRTTLGIPGVTGNSVTTVLPASNRVQIVYSVDLAAGYSHSMVNGVVDTASLTVTNTLIDFTNGVDWSIFANDAGTAIGDHKVHSVYWCANRAADLSVPANRSIFWDGLNPVDPGLDGSGYFALVPQIWFSLNHQTIANWNSGINLGSGGNFARQGSPFTDSGDI